MEKLNQRGIRFMSDNINSFQGIEINQPLYLYQSPMFMLTVSVVLIMGNGVVLLNDDDKFKFPGGIVRSGRETIEFSVVRQVKEQIGIVLKKDLLIPVDFRSSPERSPSGNVVDIGMVCLIDQEVLNYNGLRKEVDFEEKRFIEDGVKLVMDHDILMKRALEIVLMIRE